MLNNKAKGEFHKEKEENSRNFQSKKKQKTIK